jgi:hypothetical protein
VHSQKDHPALFSRQPFANRLEILRNHPLRKILFVQLRCPEKVEHAPREILIRRARNDGAFRPGQAVAKDAFEVFQRHLPAAAIDAERERSEPLRE